MPPGQRRLAVHVGGPGGPRVDGRVRGQEGGGGGGERGVGDRDGAAVRVPGPRVPPAAEDDAGAGGRLRGGQERGSVS